MDAAFFHRFVFADVGFGEFAVFFDEHGDAQSGEGDAQQDGYEDEDGE